MNRLFLICATGLLAFMFPLAGLAQSYDRLWKEVEETRKKDLPQTLISVSYTHLTLPTIRLV